ncbi:transmembrane protein 163 [Clupea harengus]|uniref:Transmembrane protein 163 n=1 Tax=Clupea harengus TaxID=7950 RepID=A0A6P3VV48_CLUHA|nr:transmembrane protein 163 [Clupea harengus]
MTDSVALESNTNPNSTTGSSTVLNGRTSPLGRNLPRSASGNMDGDHGMKVVESAEGQDLLESSLRLKPYEAQKYRKRALWVSWISIIITLILAVAAFTVSAMKNSVSAFGFGFDATLDVLSSIIVLWRYNNPAAVHSAYKEYIACLILGVVFILSSLCIVGKAVHDLATKVLPEVDDFLFIVSVVSGVLCLILAVLKFLLGKALTSRALITDGFNSFVGGIMGFSILISAEVFRYYDSVWFLDGTIGILIGLIILAYGIKLLIDMIPKIRQTGGYEPFE